jgi:hypothetical protein
MYSRCCLRQAVFVPACTGLKGPWVLNPPVGAASIAGELAWLRRAQGSATDCAEPDWATGGAAAPYCRQLLLEELRHGLHLRLEQFFERRTRGGGQRRATAAATVGSGCATGSDAEAAPPERHPREESNPDGRQARECSNTARPSAGRSPSRRSGAAQACVAWVRKRESNPSSRKEYRWIRAGGDPAQLFKEACHTG